MDQNTLLAYYTWFIYIEFTQENSIEFLVQSIYIIYVENMFYDIVRCNSH